MSFLDNFLKDEQDKNVDNSEEKSSETSLEVRPFVPDYELPLSEEMRQFLKEQIVDQMREIFDPEIPVNIYDMGLVYEINVSDEGSVDIIMTLTTPNCPVAESMPGDVQAKASGMMGVRNVNVELVWDPPWSVYMMDEAARLEMGFM